MARAQGMPVARLAPAPSQVGPPVLPTRSCNTGSGHQPKRSLAPAFPKHGGRLRFVLLGFDIENEAFSFLIGPPLSA